MTSSWFFLSTLNYDARWTTHQILEPSRLCHIQSLPPALSKLLCTYSNWDHIRFLPELDLPPVCTVMYSTFLSSRINEGTLTYAIIAFPHVVTWLEILAHFSWNFDKWQLACHFCLCARLSFFLCVRLSVRTDYHVIFIFKCFSKFCREIKFWLKSDKINGNFTCKPAYICDNISFNST